jgi:hypothetical protein
MTHTETTWPTTDTINRWQESDANREAWRQWVVTDPRELAVTMETAIGWAPADTITDPAKFTTWLLTVHIHHPALIHLADWCEWTGTRAEHAAFHAWIGDPDMECWNCILDYDSEDDGPNLDGPADDTWIQSTLERWSR